MVNKKILISTIIILLIIVTFEIIYIFFIKPTKENATIISYIGQVQQEDIENIVEKVAIPLPTEKITYFPVTPYSTPIPSLQKSTKDTTQKIYDIVKATAYLTKKTKLIQEYEGTLTNIEFLDEDVSLFGSTVHLGLKILLQSGNETPGQFLYSEETKKNIIVYNQNKEVIDLTSLTKGDRVSMKVTYNVTALPAKPESIEIIKLN